MLKLTAALYMIPLAICLFFALQENNYINEKKEYYKSVYIECDRDAGFPMQELQELRSKVWMESIQCNIQSYEVLDNPVTIQTLQRVTQLLAECNAVRDHRLQGIDKEIAAYAAHYSKLAQAAVDEKYGS